MPRIPQYDSKGQFTTQAQTPRYSPETMTQDIAAVGKAADVATQFGAKMIQIQNDQETDAANSMALAKVYDIKSRAELETDLSKLSEYEDEINEAGSEASQFIKSSIARNSFVANFNKTAIATKYAIRGNFQDKQIKQAQADLISFVGESQRIIPTLDDISRYTLVSNVKERIAAARANGTYDAVAAQKLWEDFRKNVEKGTIDRDIMNNPADTAAELAKGREGRYANIDESLRTDSIKKAHAYEAKFKRDAYTNEAIRYNKNEQLITERYIKSVVGQAAPLVESDLVRMMDNDELRPKFVDNMIKALRSNKEFKPDALESAMRYNELIERNTAIMKAENRYFGLGRVSSEALLQYRADVFAAKADGYLSDKQMNELLSPSADANKRDPGFQSALNQLRSMSTYYATPEGQARAKAEMYETMVRKIQEGIKPTKAVAETIQEKLAKELQTMEKVTEESRRKYFTKGNRRAYTIDGGDVLYDAETDEVIR